MSAADDLDLRVEEVACVGADRGRGNMLGVQPHMRLADYATERRFRAKIAGYLAAARERGWVGPRTVVVLPEYLGTWLVATGEPPGLFAERRLGRAMGRLALRHAGAFALAWLRSRGRERARAALFQVKGAAMAASYGRVFAGLAREFGATIVAGSIVLPAPAIAGGALAAGKGELRNVAAVFRPDGSLHERLARKRFLTEAEQPFVAPDLSGEPAVFDTPAGRLAVLVCADAFYPASYAALAGRGVELLAVPSYLEKSGIWNRPWPGYNGAPPPADVDPHDPGAISERAAWLKYGMAGRTAAAGIPNGLNVFLRGDILDLGSDGATIAVREGTIAEARYVAGATLLNLWL